MLIGFIISVLTVKFIQFNLDAEARFHVDSAPAVAFGLLIVPLIDMLRVVVLRFWNGKSPFKADRNHIHHTLLHFGYSHLKITHSNDCCNTVVFYCLFSAERHRCTKAYGPSYSSGNSCIIDSMADIEIEP